MPVVVGAIAVALVLGIAALILVREAGRLSAEPFPPIFDSEEAYEWVVEELPDVVAATLTPDDVRRILDFELEFFERHGMSARPGGETANGAEPAGTALVVDEVAIVDYVMERCAATGEAYLPEQVHPVIETQLRYLERIGAVGPSAVHRPGPERAPEPPPDSGTTDGPEKGGGPHDA